MKKASRIISLMLMISGAACNSSSQGDYRQGFSLSPGDETSGPRRQPKATAGDFSRFGAFEEWELRYEYSASNPYTFTEDGRTNETVGTTVDRSTWKEAESGVVILKRAWRDGDQAQYSGLGKASSMSSMTVRKTLAQTIENRRDQGTGPSVMNATVVFNFIKGTYDLDLNPGDFNLIYGGDKTDPWGSSSYGPSNEDYHITLPSIAPAYFVPKLPESGVNVDGSWSWEQYWQKEVSLNPSADPELAKRRGATSGTLRWSLRPLDPIDVELIVEPQEYDTWMPEAGADEDSPGNAIALKATLVSKTGGEPRQKAREISFRFTEVSKEKGIALNRPLTGAKTTPDLRFDPRGQDGKLVIGDDGQTATTLPGTYTEASARVAAFDWGAYGTVLVTATLEDGRKITGHLKEARELTDVLLPKRAKQSRIADRWKELAEFQGGLDEVDDDRQDGNQKHGDGLTAYEEYRGLLVGGKHTRYLKSALGKPVFQPGSKDLLVINQAGPAAAAGLRLFEEASGIRVVELQPRDVLESRLVNLNRGSASGGEQYALRLKEGALGGDVAGENRPAAELNKTPKKSLEVIIDFAAASKIYSAQEKLARAGGVPMLYTLEEDVATTIAHEIAHGIGAPHHGKVTEYFGPRELTERMPDWHAYGVDGVEIAKPFKIEGMIGRPGNEASGDSGCIMAYTNLYNWAAVGPAGGPYKFHAVGIQPVGKRFCTSSKATGYNLPHKLYNGKDAPGFFGDASGQGGGVPAGNCQGAMNVRDW